MDSLAATHTRFQRQIRTDRVVRPGGRSRASTFSSQSSVPPHRGHSRNLSSSSIASISTQSSLGGDELRRSIISDTPRNRLSLDTFPSANGSPVQQHQQPYYTVGGSSPTGYSTPTSSTFSVGTNSPRFSSGVHSPAAAAARTLAWGSKTPGRRLSVPSANPFQTPQTSYPPSYHSPLPSAAPLPAGSGQYGRSQASPLPESRRDSIDAELRRRTWHPHSYTGLGPRPTTSGLSSIQLPAAPRPVFPSQQQSTQFPRLPGIESFDHAPPQPSLIRRQPSPMQIDPPPTSNPTDYSSNATAPPEPRRGHVSWDASLQRGINQLDIASEKRSGWNAVNAPATVSEAPSNPPQQPTAPAASSSNSRTNEEPVTPKRNKRFAWYMQPPAVGQHPQSALRTSPEDSSSSDGAPTPMTTAAEYNPAIVQSGHGQQDHGEGMQGVEQQKPAAQAPPPLFSAPPSSTQPEYRPQTTVQLPSFRSTIATPPFGLERVYEHTSTQFQPRPMESSPTKNMSPLDALVAVATSAEQRV
jgi:hypothetical protein